MLEDHRFDNLVRDASRGLIAAETGITDSAAPPPNPLNSTHSVGVWSRFSMNAPSKKAGVVSSDSTLAESAGRGSARDGFDLLAFCAAAADSRRQTKELVYELQG